MGISCKLYIYSSDHEFLQELVKRVNRILV